MKLRSRVLLLYLCIVVLVLVLIGGVLPSTLHKQNLDTISEDSIRQLRHIDFALSNFIGEAKYDVLALSLNDKIQTRDDVGFTNFLNASENTFRYSVGNQEQEIIDILKDYQTTHPYVSSVYMGREDGAFVRSYSRARPTAYDPRERPWYILAKEHPGRVSVTEPYQSVTTPDVNIGIVTPILDHNGTMIGVVGADITLVNLTRYISTVGSMDGGEMILTDQKGTILASRDSSHPFGNINDILGDQTPAFLARQEGVLVLNGTYLMYYTSTELGWKIGNFVPFSTIEQKINESIQRILLFVVLALILLSVITLVALNYTVIRPLTSLTEVSRKITETGDFDQTIETEGAGEIGSLARSFKTMVEKIHTDITERRKAEDALRENEAKYHRIIETANEGVWIVDGNMNTTFVNQRFTDMLGYRREEMAGKNVLDYVITEDKAAMDTQLVDRRNGIKSRYECRLRHRDGRTIWCLISGSPILDEANSFQGSFGMITDITERKKAEEALRESEEFNRGLVENLPDIIAIYDSQGIVRFANRAALNIMGSSVSKVIGEPILSFVADYQRSYVEQKMKARLSGVQSAPYEVDIVTGSGEIITSILQAVPINYRKEPVVLVLMTNITERKQAEQKLLEAHRDLEKKVDERTWQLSEANLHLQELDRLKSLFIASMSHELRTPLNSIIGFTGIMVKGLAGEINPEQKKQLGMVQDSARHLLALINDVIDISKIEADKIEAGVSTFNLSDVLRDVKNTYDPSAKERGLVLNIEIPGPVAVTSDDRRIKQIIMNLVSNAIKFTDEGNVDLTVEQRGSVVQVRVSDTGIGIGKEDLEQLFRPFSRIAVPGRLVEGTGLGLYLSKKLARFLGGDITAESEPHKGSVFTFSFPITYEKQGDT